jgi:hypothetical protein
MFRSLHISWDLTNMRKPDLDVMRRVLHAHHWSNICDWVRAVDDLADLKDDEIERLASPSSTQDDGQTASAGGKLGRR